MSRKTNTTRSEALGAVTRGDTQILLYDTPGAPLRAPLPRGPLTPPGCQAW